MEYVKCDNCGEEFTKEEIENHKLYCIFSLQNSEFENMIPCEICNELIPFDSYNSHISTCGLSPLLNIPNIIQIPLIQHTNDIGGLFNINSNNNLNNNEESQEADENAESQEADENAESQEADENAESNNQITIPNSLPEIDNFLQNTELLIQNINNVNNYLNIYNPLNSYEELINLDNNNENLGIQNTNKFLTDLEEEIVCPICTEKSDISCKTSCGHKFCRECIEEWLKENKKCPICMKEFIE